jgi:hypothetical protein
MVGTALLIVGCVAAGLIGGIVLVLYKLGSGYNYK